MTTAKSNGTGPAPSGAFRFRRGTKADLPYFSKLLPQGFCVDPSIRKRLPEAWEKLLETEAHTLTVVEDLQRKFPDSVDGFGLSVFVTDEFADEIATGARPFVSALFYERLLAGDEVLLSSEKLAAANAANGINVLSLHFGLENHDLADARTAQIVMAGGGGFYFFHGGYRIRTLLNEVYGMQAVRFMEAGGLRLVHDFQTKMPHAFMDTPPDDYPYLFELRRDWVEPGAVNPLSQLFFTPPPRIHFSAAERRVLEHALLNESDAAVAAWLGISTDAVKKNWRNIYDRVSERAPYVIPAEEHAQSGGRGQEKRRHLLDYLRTHLEELRPWPN